MKYSGAVSLVGLLMLFFLGTPACQSSDKSCGETAQYPDSVKVFPYPDIPATLVDTESRESYLIHHYWDRYDFSDTLLLKTPEVTEQGIVNFLALLSSVSVSEVNCREGMATYCQEMLRYPHAYQIHSGILERYLYSSLSPMYNEKLYALYLECLLKAMPPDEPTRSAMEYTLRLIRRNAVGTSASDFPYRTPEGKQRSLYSTKGYGKYLLLFFYDPDCDTCHQLMDVMREDTQLDSYLKSHLVTILAVNTQALDSRWEEARSRMPDGWMHGCDNLKIIQEGLYDLKAMPTYYLLDKHHRVLLKDPSYPSLMEWLSQHP